MRRGWERILYSDTMIVPYTYYDVGGIRHAARHSLSDYAFFEIFSKVFLSYKCDSSKSTDR